MGWIRFHKQPENQGGNVDIADIMNTEAVCTIYAKYHPYAPDIIVKALNEAFGEVELNTCACGKDKPQDWLHCGCEQIFQKGEVKDGEG